MKRSTRWIALAALFCPGAVIGGCSAVLVSVRDAAISGLADFVTETTFNLLDEAVNPDASE